MPWQLRLFGLDFRARLGAGFGNLGLQVGTPTGAAVFSPAPVLRNSRRLGRSKEGLASPEEANGSVRPQNKTWKTKKSRGGAQV